MRRTTICRSDQRAALLALVAGLLGGGAPVLRAQDTTQAAQDTTQAAPAPAQQLAERDAPPAGQRVVEGDVESGLGERRAHRDAGVDGPLHGAVHAVEIPGLEPDHRRRQVLLKRADDRLGGLISPARCGRGLAPARHTVVDRHLHQHARRGRPRRGGHTTRQYEDRLHGKVEEENVHAGDLHGGSMIAAPRVLRYGSCAG